MRLLRSLAAFAALSLALLFCAEDADARWQGQADPNAPSRILLSSLVSPRELVALDHTMTGQAMTGQQSGSLGGLFSRPGVVGGFAAGFLGAGVLGLLFGHGLVGELGGAASYLGLLFQLALIVLLCRLIWTWWWGRNAPAFAGLSPRQLADPYLRSRNEMHPGDGADVGGDRAAKHSSDESSGPAVARSDRA